MRTNSPRMRSPAGESLARCRRRLMEDLGLSAEDADLILHLRSQVLALQEQVQNLENELWVHHRHQEARLSIFQVNYGEAIWREEDDNG